MPQSKIGTTGEIPWDANSMSIGMGYEIDEYQCARSPFLTLGIPNLDKSSSEIRFESQTIKADRDLATAINLTLDSSLAAPAISSTSASVRCLQDVKFDSRHTATIIRCSITCTPQRYVAQPLLTNEAEACLRTGPEKFLSKYGQHFVAGQVCQSTLLAIYVHSASSSQELDEFKSTFSSSQALTGSIGLSSVAQFTEEVKSSKISTDIFVNIMGMRTESAAQIFSLSEIIPVFQGFLKDYSPKPYLALLQHYALVVADIPRPQNPWTIPPDLIYALQRSIAVKIKSKSCAMEGALKVTQAALKLHTTLEQIELRDADWAEKLFAWSDEAENIEKQIDVWLRRQALVEKAVEKRAQRWPRYLVLFEGASTDLQHPRSDILRDSELLLKSQRLITSVKWQTGIDVADFSTLAAEIHYECHKEQSLYDGAIGVLHCQEGKARHESSDRLVVAIKITNETDSEPNWVTKTLMRGNVGLLIRPVRHVYKATVTGLWKLEIWSVDRSLYAKHVYGI